MGGVEEDLYEGPSPSTVALIAHYAQPRVGEKGEKRAICREFESVKEARTSLKRMTEFRDRLKGKGMEGWNASDVFLLYCRCRGSENVWIIDSMSRGRGQIEAIELGHWLGLRTRRIFEHGVRRWIAYLGGYFLRGILYLVVLRHEPRLEPRSQLPKWTIKCANGFVRLCWPRLRLTINQFVNAFVPRLMNSAIAKMPRRPVEKITFLNLDVGPYPPVIAALAASPTLARNKSQQQAIDFDLGIFMPGDGIRLQIDVNLFGDDKPDLRGELVSCQIAGTLRLKLGPLIHPLPCARELTFGFAAKPDLRLCTHFRLHQATGLPVGLSLDLIDRFIFRLIENALESTLCWPRAIGIPIAAFCLGPDFLISTPQNDDHPINKKQKKKHTHQKARGIVKTEADVIGQLRVEVLRCTNLINNDMSGLSDPYVICKLGQREERTSTMVDTLDPVWDTPRTFVFDVHEASQQCTLSVYDSEADTYGAFNDAILGRAHFSLQDLLIDQAPNPQQTNHSLAQPTPPTLRHFSKQPATELRLALDTSIYDGKFASLHDSSLARQDSAVFILAKFSPSPEAIKQRNDRPTGLVPLALAAVYVFCLGLLVDLLARDLFFLLADVLARIFVSIALFLGLAFLIVSFVGALV